MAGKRIAIIGAGLGGLVAAIKLQQAGHTDIQLFDRNDKVGGTWAENQYPGSQCDVPILLYQLSFAPSFTWSRLFATAPEIQRYCEEITDRYRLRDRIHLSEPVTSARWNDSSRTWTVQTSKGRLLEVDVVIGALGQLNRPQWPDINGRESFAGESMHSARWNHNVDFTGKRVAVIGSAASAVQIVPALAKTVAQLSVFQRSPNWLLPRNDRPVPPEEMMLMATDMAKALELSDMMRRYIFDNADHFFWQAFQWTPAGRAAFTRISLNHLEAQVEDPALRQQLTPNYPIGCKRVLFCDDYYPALQKPNVDLVTTAIDRIVPGGIVTADGRQHDVDIIVYATGFETTEWKWSVDIIGSDGRHLNQAWADAPEAYLGIGVAGFPNLFVMYGPNTNLGHNSITFMLECQGDYIVKALAALDTAGARAMAPNQAAQDAFNARLQEQLNLTAWADPSAGNWYRNARGRITQNWSSHARDYAAATADVNLGDYDLLP
ncbi:MAG: NAD(P)/FAD-dependent oxidoreductase [Gammaproteobacteria bacterium]